MERDEVEKVYIRRGKLNEDGERLDIIKSKATGTEYQPGAIDDKMETWGWRLRQPGDAADMRETRNMKEIPRPHDLRPRNLDSPPLPPHAPHPSASPPSAVSRKSETLPSFSRNLDKPLSWAEEYSAKRPSRGRPRKGPPQPRFHMSWGAHWKGNSGTRDIHFASTLQLQLNRDIMSSPPPFPVGQDDTSTIRKPDVPFDERLRQSRAAITKLHTQLKLYTNPIQSAMGHLPQFRNQTIARPHIIDLSFTAAGLFGQPIIRAAAGMSSQRPAQQRPDKKPSTSLSRPFGEGKKILEYPSFATMTPGESAKHDSNSGW
jgi:hypothetical protein